jgi:hypothetical protein
VDEQAGPIGYALVVLPAFLVLVAGGFLGRWVRRRRRLDRPSG